MRVYSPGFRVVYGSYSQFLSVSVRHESETEETFHPQGSSWLAYWKAGPRVLIQTLVQKGGSWSPPNSFSETRRLFSNKVLNRWSLASVRRSSVVIRIKTIGTPS